MRRLLLTTSVLALASGSMAHAVEWEVAVGGYFETYAAYASPDVAGFAGDDFDGVDSKTESEVHFLPSITLDNGLQIGADIQLEGGGYLNTPDTIDEQFVFVDGSFGRLLFGSENSAGYLMSYGAPDVTFVNVNSGSLTKFIPFSGNVGTNNGQAGIPAGGLAVGNDLFNATLGSTYIENGGNNAANRFTYFTPRFAGLQLGLSYARDQFQDTNAQLNLNGDALNHIVDIGANYVETIGGVGIVLAGRWGFASDDRAPVAGTDIGDDPEVWAAALNLGYAGVTVGGSFAEQNDAGALDGHAWDAGIAYATGPWGFSFTYFHGENVDDENQFALRNDEELDQYLVGASYALAEGVDLNVFGAYVDFDEETGDAGGPNAGGDDVDGWVVGTGMKLSW